MASVAKRKWVAPDGTEKEAWLVRYVDKATGKRAGRTFARKKDADTYKHKVESEIRDGTHVASSKSYTVAVMGRDYLKAMGTMHKEGRLALGTLKKEAFYFDGHILPDLGHRPVRDLNTADVDSWIIGLRRKTHSQRHGQTLQPASVKQMVSALGRALDYAIRRKLVAKNVAKEVSNWREHRAAKNEPIRTFTLEEAKRLLASIEHQDHGLTAKKKVRARPGWTRRSEALTRCAVYLAAFAGLRLGEVLGLTWENIDFDAGMIRVRHSLDAWDNLKGPKTKAGRRDVPMAEKLATELEAWRAHAIDDPRGLIFRTKTGGRLSTAGFHKNYWQPALEDASLGPDATGRRFHFHALRHFCASMMIAGNIPLPDVASLLGHSSFDMTLQVYAHPVIGGNRKAAAIEAMARAMHEKPVAADTLLTHSL